MRSRSTSLSDLTGSIYSAAENPEEWTGVLERLADVVGAATTALVFQDFESRTASTEQVVGIDQEWIRKFEGHYTNCNPWVTTARPWLKNGVVTTSQRVLPDAELVRTEYYNDFLKKMDLHHLLAVCLFAEPATLSSLSILRPRRRGPFEEDEVELLRSLVPHLQRALRIHQKMTELVADRDAVADVLDQVPLGIVLVNAGERPLRVNRAAEEILTSRDGLSLIAGRLVASRSDETGELSRALVQAVRGKGQRRSGSSVAVSRPSGRRPFSILISPVCSETILGVSRPAAVVFITDPEKRVKTSAEVLRRLYGLTPAEAKLAGRLAQGNDVLAAAEDLGVTLNTARTHLKSLFSKTGTHRQAELVRALLICGANLEVESARDS